MKIQSSKTPTRFGWRELRRYSLVSLLVLGTLAAQAQMYVSGRFLYSQAGEKVVLKGPNEFFWPIGDLDAAARNEMAEIAKTGANCVRIGWLDAANRPLSSLDSLIANCIKNKMIPVVACHDATDPDWAKLNKCLTFWKRPDVVSLITKYKKWVVLNIANEEGTYTAPSPDYKNYYTDAIAQLRSAGYDVPFMIDASDYGQNEKAIFDNWQALTNADPRHSVLYSLHTYWQSNDGGGDVNVRFANFVNRAVSGNVPVVIGEGVQPAGFACGLDWDYVAAIRLLQNNDIGWMPWSWGGAKNGNCGQFFDMTTNAKYGSWSNQWAQSVLVDDLNSIQKTAIRPVSIGGMGQVLFSVNLTAPAAFTTATTGSSITLTATATQGSTQASKVEYFQGATKIGEATAPPFTYIWTNLPTGVYQLTARATSAIGGTATTPSATTISVFPASTFSGTYKFTSKGSGKVMDNPGGTATNLTQLVQNTDTGNLSQQWIVSQLGGGLYKITNKAGGTCLDLYGASTANGAQIQIYDCTGSVQQKWNIVQVDATYYTITNASSGKCVEVSSLTSTDGVKIDQSDYVGLDNQKWQVQLVSGGTTVAVTGVNVVPTSITVAAGATSQLIATISPTNATNQNVTWTSSNNAVVTVSSNGLVTGVSAGMATITVTTADGGKTDFCTVTVPAVSGGGNGTFVYDDALQSGWTVSGGSTYNLNNTAVVKNGSKAISVIFPGGYYTVEFNHSPAFSTSGYTAVKFWAYGGTNATKAQLIFLNAGGSETGRKAFTFTPGQWVQYTVNLSEVGSPAQISKIIVQDYSGNSQPIFYVDDLTFTGAGARLASAVEEPFRARLYPNPAGNQTTVAFYVGVDQQVTLTVLDMAGRTAQQVRYAATSGVNRINHALPLTIAAGVYLMQVQHDDRLETMRFLIQK